MAGPARMGHPTVFLGFLLSLVLLSGCATTEQSVAAIAAGATAAGAHSPTHEIQQVYYLGAFDPQGQVRPSFYRITVRGQASFISFAKFASGWVPAELVDSLNTRFVFNAQTKEIEMRNREDGVKASLKTGRRMVLFGPEGFREAPKDQRLVIVMGSNADDFFKAVDDSLGIMAGALGERALTDVEMRQEIRAELVRLLEQREKLLDRKLKLREDQ